MILKLRPTFFLAYVVVLLTLMGLLPACSQTSFDSDNWGAQNFRILWWVEGERAYRIQDVFLEDLTSIENLSGRHAQFFLSPKMQGEEGEKEITGASPKLRFRSNRDGVWVPLDQLSSEVASLYGNFQRLHHLDQEVGVSDSSSLPVRVGIRTKLQASDNSGSYFVQNNAFYDYEKDMFFLVPYTAQELALTQNAGVIAHEHFHSLFARIFLRPLLLDSEASQFVGVHSPRSKGQAKNEHPEKQPAESPPAEKQQNNPPQEVSGEELTSPEKLPQNQEQNQKLRKELKRRNQEYQQVFLRALNEGLADFWGWVYTGDLTFVGRSLREESERRDLGKPIDLRYLRSQSVLMETFRLSKDKLKRRESLLVLSYKVGVEIARQMVQLSGESNLSRTQVARELIQFLKVWQPQYQAAAKKVIVKDPLDFLYGFLDHLEKVEGVNQSAIEGRRNALMENSRPGN